MFLPLPLQLTWSGLGHLTSLTNLRSLNCSGIRQQGDSADNSDGTAKDERLHRLLGRLHRLVMGDACTLSWVDDGLMGVMGTHATSLKELDCSGCIDMTNAGMDSTH